MKILVCISHVPDTTSKINFVENNTQFDTQGVQFVINPYDEFSLTRAMWFKEKAGAHVTVVNVGKADSEPTLRKALAIGADEAIRIDTEAKDSISVAKELAEVVKNNSYDLILTGKESIDYNNALVPGMLSALTDIEFVNACMGMEVNGDEVLLEKEIEGGTAHLKASLPLIVAGQKGLVEEKDLKIPNMRGIMMARKKPLKVLAAMAAETETSINSFEKPAEKAACKMVAADQLDELVELLHKEAKVL